MKFLTLLFSIALMFNANAGLITTDTDNNSYDIGDIITVDFVINNPNPVIDFTYFEFVFDESIYDFINVGFTSNVDSYLDWNSYAELDFFTSNIIVISAEWLSGWQTALGNSFTLAQATFELTSDAFNSDFLSLDYIEVIDVTANGDVYLDESEFQVAVPEPTTLLLFAGVALMLFVNRRKTVR